jgi:hypothetical protein
MDYDWYMFTPAEHEYLHFMKTNKLPSRFKHLVPHPKKRAKRLQNMHMAGWRVYGDKRNERSGVHRRYYKCVARSSIRCTARRVLVYKKNGDILDDIMHHPHGFNCPHHP